WNPADSARRTSHPDWLARRWTQAWGGDEAEALMAWNQLPALHYLHVESAMKDLPGAETRWPGFRTLESGDWPEALLWISRGRAYVQDPATRHPVQLASPRPGESVL